MTTLITKNNQLYIVIESHDGTETWHPVIAGWESFSGWYWFSIEEAEHDENDIIHFGFVQGHECELGYFSQAELESMPGMVWPIKAQALASSGRR